MTDETDNVDAAIDALLRSGNMPSLARSTPFAQQAMRGCMSALMAEAYVDGCNAAMETPEGQDTARLDWLLDPSQSIGNVTLDNNVPGDGWDLRAAIDAAMELEAGKQ